MKQTAVKWLIDVLRTEFIGLYNDIIEQAKEMEKQQIIDAYYDGKNDIPTTTEEQYYNETFNK